MRTALVLSFALLLAADVAAQQSSDLVSWRVRAERAERGATARLVLDAEVADGWQLYGLGSTVGIPLTVTLGDLPRDVAVGTASQVGALEAYDTIFEADYPYFIGTGRVIQRLRVGRQAARGTHEVTGRVRYAVCDDSICLPPATTSFRVPLVVE